MVQKIAHKKMTMFKERDTDTLQAAPKSKRKKRHAQNSPFRGSLFLPDKEELN